MTNSWRFSTLIDRHRALGSDLEDWSGMGTAWSYSKGDPDAEYMAIRTKAGLMDVSGLKKVHITGPAASHVIERATTRNMEKLMPGRSVYATMLNDAGLFVPIYVISGIWQGVGWGSIIYLAALTGIDQELYQAASIDGAGRWKQTLHVTLPGLLPTIIVLLILRTGNILSVGAEKVILLYNPSIYETSDVISSYVYRRGLLNADWSFSSAVGLFNSVVNFILVASVNWLARRTSDTSLW